MPDLKSVIESLLFVAGRPVSLKELAKTTGNGQDEIKSAIEELIREKEDAGIVILEQNSSYLITTNPANSAVVKDFLNAELREKLTDASLETLAIVTYKQPISRAEIESIRGVNSQYSLRLLTMRGLIERTQSEKDARMGLYRTTHEFLQHMGLKNLKDLPDFDELASKVKPPEEFFSIPSETPTSPPHEGEIEKGS